MSLSSLALHSAGSPGKHPGEIIVQFKDVTKANRLSASSARHGAKLVRTLRGASKDSLLNRTSVITVPEGTAFKDTLASFRSDPDVSHAEPNYVLHVSEAPNDPWFIGQWSLSNTGQAPLRGPLPSLPGADIAWLDAMDLASASGGFTQPTVVAVIDTGIDYSHEDLAAVIWNNAGEIAGNGIDDDGNGYVDDVRGYNFVDDSPDPMDDDEYSHGTHLAGIIGAVARNAQGVAGVASNVRLMPLKAFGPTEEGNIADIIEAIMYATANGAQIINASFGAQLHSQFQELAVRYAVGAGVLFVAAAGNEHSNSELIPSTPASINVDGLVAVAATEYRDRMTEYSNWGHSCVHLGAPGDLILSTVRQSAYGLMSGTSMATPMVSGAAAALLSLGRPMGPSELSRRLLESVDPVPALGCRTISGGRLNLENLLEAALGTDVVAPAAITDLVASNVGPDFALLHFTAPGDDQASGRARAYEVRTSSALRWPGFSAAQLHCITTRPHAAGSVEYIAITDLEPSLTYRVQVRAMDNGGNESFSNVVTVKTGAANPVVWSDDLESGVGTWTTQSSGTPWSIAACPTGRSGKCWLDSDQGNYGENVRNALFSPVIDLTHAARAQLSFEQRYDFESGYDFGTVEVSRDGGEWSTLYRVTDSSSGWTMASIDLGAAVGAQIRLRFVVTSDEAENADGWAIGAPRVTYVDAETLSESALDESFDDGARWSMNGSWAIEAGVLSDSPSGYYPTWKTSATTLASPLDLSAFARAQLRFDLAYAFEEGRDYLLVEASTDGELWDELARYTGPVGGGYWASHVESLNFDAYAGYPAVWLRFVLSSDSTGAADGATIDTLHIDVERAARCGNGRVEGTEQCDAGASAAGSSCCLADCTRAPSGAICRVAAGACDVAETCSGSSAECPTDVLNPQGHECRAANGPCDVPEYCSGSSPLCPADAAAGLGTLCRAAVGICDLPERCNGLTVDCPVDSFASTEATCRSSAGPCDVPEYCSGSSPQCPDDQSVAAGIVCRAASGICDPAEHCDGSSALCPVDEYATSDTICQLASCADGVEILGARCDGAGHCPATVTRACAPFACSGQSCANHCSSEIDCASGMFCRDGACVATLALGQSCTTDNQCSSGLCTNGRCGHEDGGAGYAVSTGGSAGTDLGGSGGSGGSSLGTAGASSAGASSAGASSAGASSAGASSVDGASIHGGGCNCAVTGATQRSRGIGALLLLCVAGVRRRAQPQKTRPIATA